MISAFTYKRSLIKRSARVITQPVLVRVTRGIEAREIPRILVVSSYHKAKGSDLLSRAIGSIIIKRHQSSFLALTLPVLLLVELGKRETLLEITVGQLPEGVLLLGYLL